MAVWILQLHFSFIDSATQFETEVLEKPILKFQHFQMYC